MAFAVAATLADPPASAPAEFTEVTETTVPALESPSNVGIDFHFNPFHYETAFSPGENETSPTVEMDEIDSEHTALLNIPFLDAPFKAGQNVLGDLEDATGLRVRFAYTMLFQQASNGPGDRSAGAGDLDIMAAWTLLGRGTADTGRLIVTGEYRFGMGNITPNALGPEIGSLQRTAGGFSDRGWVVRDFHWVQRLFEGRLRLLVGRSDVSDYVGGHRLQSINNSFLNRQFSSNSTTAFPAGHATSAGVSIQPIDEFYVTFGGANAYGSTNVNDWSTLGDGDYFGFAEFGYTPRFEGLGWGRYALLIWNMPTRENTGQPSDSGFSVMLEQDFGANLHAFGRYGWAADGTTGIKQAGEVGVGYRGLLGSPDNLTGLAVGISEPTASGLRDEKVIELFHRFQLTPYSQLTFGIQGIFDPSNSPDVDGIAVFETRLRVEF